MTPEERAKELVHNLADGTRHQLLIEVIATAIREAENDALERAAVKAEGPANDWGEFPGNVIERDRIAHAIRALKSKD